MPNAGNVDLCLRGKKRLEKWRAGVLSVNQGSPLTSDVCRVRGKHVVVTFAQVMQNSLTLLQYATDLPADDAEIFG